MERTDKAAVIAADVGWSDVGLWSTVWRLSERDARRQQPARRVRWRSIARNVLVRSNEQLTAVVGLENVIVVTTPDAVLVVDASSRIKSSNWSTSSRRTNDRRRRSTSAPIAPGATIKASMRARAIRSSASS